MSKNSLGNKSGKLSRSEAGKVLEMKGKSTDTSWGFAAGWYDEMVEKEGSCHREIILPNLLRLMNIKSGEKVLDIACGQGFFSREFAKVGAVVFGIDISSELIALARKRSEGWPIEYAVAPADKISFSGEKLFDKAVAVMALQDIKNLSGVFAEASRLLQKNGSLFLVINHPAFRIPKRSVWGFDEKNKIQFRRMDEYMSESRIKISVHPGKDLSAETAYFHRPLQVYFKFMEKFGLTVSRLEEWVSNRKSEAGPRADAENKARREFPLFLAMVAKKLKIEE